jgi:hypothetical protein
MKLEARRLPAATPVLDSALRGPFFAVAAALIVRSPALHGFVESMCKILPRIAENYNDAKTCSHESHRLYAT